MGDDRDVVCLGEGGLTGTTVWLGECGEYAFNKLAEANFEKKSWPELVDRYGSYLPSDCTQKLQTSIACASDLTHSHDMYKTTVWAARAARVRAGEEEGEGVDGGVHAMAAWASQKRACEYTLPASSKLGAFNPDVDKNVERTGLSFKTL